MIPRSNDKVALKDTQYEQMLVARFQSGDPDAMTTLFEMHVDRVFAYTRHLLGNREDAEEVTSEAFVRAFQRASTFRGDCPIRGWIFGIARNLCFDRLRQPRLVFIEPEEAQRITDQGRSMAQMETGTLVRRAIAELSDDHRLVLMLCDVEEWDAREVAAMLEKSLAATKSLLYRARRALKEKLTEKWSEEE